MRVSRLSGEALGTRVTNPAMPHIRELTEFSHKIGVSRAGRPIFGFLRMLVDEVCCDWGAWFTLSEPLEAVASAASGTAERLSCFGEGGPYESLAGGYGSKDLRRPGHLSGCNRLDDAAIAYQREGDTAIFRQKAVAVGVADEQRSGKIDIPLLLCPEDEAGQRLAAITDTFGVRAIEDIVEGSSTGGQFGAHFCVQCIEVCLRVQA